MLEFPEPDLGPAGRCNFEYDDDYLIQWIGKVVPAAQVSARLPIAFGPVCRSRWPAFLDDLRPMGSAARWWLRRLDLQPVPASEMELLRRATIAPIGNVRVEEPLPPERQVPRRFPRQAVIDREHAFLEDAAAAGAQVGCATGAGGDSPKLLLRQDASGHVWIDVWQDEPLLPDHHYVVKFARTRSERDHLILRSEHVYYRALAALGVETIPLEGMHLEEGPGGPSLWLPRFDVWRDEVGREIRLGVESASSLVEGGPGSYQTHQKVLTALQSVVSAVTARELTLEYLRRDLLNLVFGNSDNHGRNLAVLRTQDSVKLAPIFDFAPMKMDLEGITRPTTWAGFERGGEVDWPALLASFGRDVTYLRDGPHDLARKLRTLPTLLGDLGLPDETMRFAALDLQGTERRLGAWGFCERL